MSRYDRLPSALWVNDHGCILDCCAHTQEVFGYWRDELKGPPTSIVLPDLDRMSMLDEGESARNSLFSADAPRHSGV